MNLSSFLHPDPGSARFERKVILSPGQSRRAEFFLYANGFRSEHRIRKVTSIYFDDINLSCWRDNIDGNSSRDKLRVRFYDDDIANAKLEIKHKRGYLGYKTTKASTGSAENLEDLVGQVLDWSKLMLSRQYHPSAYVQYNRTYFRVESFRATIDRDVVCSKFIGDVIVPGTYKKFEVLEFKYPRNCDDSFRTRYPSFSKFALRTTKSSKYSIAMDF